MSENTQRKLVTKKKVTVRCIRPFRLGMTPFSGYCPNIILKVEDIAKIIESKSMVEEVLSTGETVPLDFSNYNTYNGPTEVTDDSIVVTDSKAKTTPVIRRFTADGKEIIPENKPKFGGGFRKDPRTTGQLPPLSKEKQVEKKEASTKIELNMSVKQEAATKENTVAKETSAKLVNNTTKEAVKPAANNIKTENVEKKTEAKK